MKNNYSRWYDKDPRMKSLISFLELSSPQMKVDVCMDILQIIIQDGLKSADEVMNFSCGNNIGKAERWYDRNEYTHSAIELLRMLNDNEKDQIFPEIINGILYFNKKLALV